VLSTTLHEVGNPLFWVPPCSWTHLGTPQVRSLRFFAKFFPCLLIPPETLGQLGSITREATLIFSEYSENVRSSKSAPKVPRGSSGARGAAPEVAQNLRSSHSQFMVGPPFGQYGAPLCWWRVRHVLEVLWGRRARPSRPPVWRFGSVPQTPKRPP
jgi:hypothetical protein